MLLMLSGAIGAGKDTFADLLIDQFEKLGFNAGLVKFADPIRNVAFEMGFNPDDRETKELAAIRHYNLSDLSDAVFKGFPLLDPYHRRIIAVKVHQRLIHIRKEKHDGIFKPVVSTREFMQVLGGEVRKVDESYYIKAMLSNCPTGRVNICSDCRFVNEQAIGDASLYILRPNNPLAVKTVDSSEAAQDALRHAAHYIVLNTGTLDDLSATAETIAKLLIIKGLCNDAQNSGRTGSSVC